MCDGLGRGAFGGRSEQEVDVVSRLNHCRGIGKDRLSKARDVRDARL